MFLGLENWEQPWLRWETCKAGTFLNKNDPERGNLGKMQPNLDTKKTHTPICRRLNFCRTRRSKITCKWSTNNLELVYDINLPNRNQFPLDIFLWQNPFSHALVCLIVIKSKRSKILQRYLWVSFWILDLNCFLCQKHLRQVLNMCR